MLRHTHQKGAVIKIIAHRGFSSQYIENSLESFRQALMAGIQSLELDVHLTADGIPVVVHDPVISSRLFKKNEKSEGFWEKPISQIQWSELSQMLYRVEKFSEQETRVHSLEEVLSLSKEFPDSEWNVEIKYEDRSTYPDRKKIVEAIWKVCAENLSFKNIVFFSFDIEILKLLQEKRTREVKSGERPRLNLLYEGKKILGEKVSEKLKLEKLRSANWKECREIIESLEVDVFAPHYKLLKYYPRWKKYFSKEVRTEKNIQLYAWTVNSKEELTEDLLQELDAVITDCPLDLMTRN